MLTNLFGFAASSEASTTTAWKLALGCAQAWTTSSAIDCQLSNLYIRADIIQGLKRRFSPVRKSRADSATERGGDRGLT
jgi:hypothetical protein